MHKSAVILAGLAFLALSCRRRAEATPDPARVDAAPVTPKPLDTLLRDGDLIDLEHGKLLPLARARGEASDGTSAFIRDEKQTVHAFNLADGTERWRRELEGSVMPGVSLSDGYVAVLAEPSLLILDKRNGDLRTIKLGNHLGHGVGLSHGFAISREKSVMVVDTTWTTTTYPLPFELIGYRAGLYALADKKTVCALRADRTLDVVCIGGATVTVDLRLPIARVGASFNIIAVDEQFVLYGTQHNGHGLRRAAVVRLADGAVTRVEEHVAAIVKRADGNLEGLLVVDPELRLLDATGKLRWTAPVKHVRPNAVAISRDGRLFVALYDELTTGSELFAFDLQSGALLWTGDVERLPIGHSEYRNAVSLSSFRDRILLRGDESAMITTQMFASATGARVFAFSHFTR